MKPTEILDWIEAFDYLVEMDIKYFELSINEEDSKKRKSYREISDYFNLRVEELINGLTI